MRGGGRVWAVGSVHGEAARLAALHRELAVRFRTGDQIVYLGNYFGCGAEVRRAVDDLLIFRRSLLARTDVPCEDIVYLRGAQEEMWRKLLQLHLAPNPREVLEWMLDQGVDATITAYGGHPQEGLLAAQGGATAITRWTGTLRAVLNASDGHGQLMSILRHAAYTDDKGLLFVHAGVDPSRPLSAQSDSFWWSSNTFSRIDASYAGFRRVVRGFTRQDKGVQVGLYTATVDAGCGFGGPLVAVCFDADGKVISTIEA
ncbi:MAG: hypothetical protein HQL37_03495 [Alphaproteobacteria bacterium]|nr:hypothetical protein [Alphaproteobacteria bacterium]